MLTIRNVPPRLSTISNLPAPGTLKKELGISPTTKIVGFVGRLETVKGCHFLIKAISQLPDTSLDISFVIVGEGTQRQSLEHLAKNLNIDHQVYFCGFRNDPANVFRSLDLYVLPSLDEGIPLAMLEAMSHGVPVVATSVGGIPEVIRNRINGILVPAKDPYALAEAIYQSLNYQKDTAERIQEAKKTIIKEYDVGKWTKIIQNDYLAML